MIRWEPTGPYEIVFTTRTGGVSEGPYASLNLGRKTGDDLAADCLPIVLVRENGAAPAVCVLHAGRIGLLAGIVEAGVTALDGGVAAAIGPSIGPCCYEVGEEVAAPYRERFGAGIMRGGKLDLWHAAERELREAGVAQIERLDLCTACNPDLFFSHRRDGKPRGVQGVLASIAGDVR